MTSDPVPVVEQDTISVSLHGFFQTSGAPTLPAEDLVRITDANLESMKRLISLSHGIILITGPTGSGKTTSLYAALAEINSDEKNVITIEDPIEYNIDGISQIQVSNKKGLTFASGLRSLMRQDPDVMMVGEIRDGETAGIAVQAANTGHLLMSTLHTIDATQTINRVISFFPTHQHQEVRLLLSSCLAAIVSMRLIPRIDGQGRVPACEVMLCTPTIQEYIIDPDKTVMIRQAIMEGHLQYGMQTFDQSLMKLYKEGIISFEDALANSTSPDEFTLRAKGIEASSDASWEVFEGSLLPEDSAEE